jgi:anti-sigma factor ChrR (cupin superfamily)
VSASSAKSCQQTELVALYVLGALPAEEILSMEAHLEVCPACHQEWRTLAPTVEAFAAWPTDVLRPSPSLWGRLSERIAGGRRETSPALPPQRVVQPEWEQVAPGISCKFLADDAENHQVSMLVRLEPGAEYPPHRHAGVEELHLLDGELWIDDRKLYPGDYNRAEPGTADRRVWSETGCTCVLITSTRDVLG